MIGNEPYLRATWSRLCAFSRCCQSGVRLPGRRRGMSSARDGVLAEARAEERRLAELADDEVLELRPGRSSSSSTGGGWSASGKCSAMPSSDQIDWASRPSAVAQPRRQRHRPRRVHAGAERRQHADPPVADLVAEPLDHDGAVGRAPRRSPRPARAGT